MPALKKRAGKTSFTLYAAEVRQIRGAIETLNFIELNGGDSPLASNAGVLSSGLGEVLIAVQPKPAQQELIQEEVEADAEQASPSGGRMPA